ncbi:MAG: hypothetical protein WBM52_21160, partial [Thiogranum sp.]
MTFNTLTLFSVLFTLFYMVLLIAFNSRKVPAKHAAMFVFKDSVDEAYAYGARRNTSVQPAPGPCHATHVSEIATRTPSCVAEK